MSQDAYLVMVEGLDILDTMERIPPSIRRAAQAAVNKTTDRARAASAREMRDQINFPARYLTGADGRLTIDKSRLKTDLTGVIRGRARPTSLARFLVGKPKPGKVGVTVEVKPGARRTLPRTFAIRLRSGSASLDTQFNLGLAVRTKDGEKPAAAYKPRKVGRNLWLLYGPSVNQVFYSVSEDVAPDQAEFLEAEFRRLITLEGL